MERLSASEGRRQPSARHRLQTLISPRTETSPARPCRGAPHRQLNVSAEDATGLENCWNVGRGIQTAAAAAAFEFDMRRCLPDRCETGKRDLAQGVFHRYQGLEQNNVVNRESKIKWTRLQMHIPIVSYWNNVQFDWNCVTVRAVIMHKYAWGRWKTRHMALHRGHFPTASFWCLFNKKTK